MTRTAALQFTNAAMTIIHFNILMADTGVFTIFSVIIQFYLIETLY